MRANLNKALRISIQAILLLLLAAYMVTGLGITESRTVETFTLGILTKPVAFSVHNNLLWPFVIFLGLHIAYKPLSRLIFKNRMQ